MDDFYPADQEYDLSHKLHDTISHLSVI